MPDGSALTTDLLSGQRRFGQPLGQLLSPMTLFVNKNNQQLGPLTLAQAQRMVATGVLLATDAAWHEGLPEWLPLQEIPGFSERVVTEVPRPDLYERPILVWIISLFYFISFPVALVSLIVLPLFSSGALPLRDKHLSDLQPTSPLEYSFAWLNLLLTMAWAIQFFRLRRTAFPLSVLNLIFFLATTGYSILFEGWLSAVANGGLAVIIATIIGWSLNFLLLGYTWHLLRKGVLF